MWRSFRFFLITTDDLKLINNFLLLLLFLLFLLVFLFIWLLILLFLLIIILWNFRNSNYPVQFHVDLGTNLIDKLNSLGHSLFFRIEFIKRLPLEGTDLRYPSLKNIISQLANIFCFLNFGYSLICDRECCIKNMLPTNVGTFLTNW